MSLVCPKCGSGSRLRRGPDSVLCACGASFVPEGPERGSPVATVDDLVRKYGYQTIDLAVQRLVAEAPPFPGDSELASLLGEMMADLNAALKDHIRRGGYGGKP